MLEHRSKDSKSRGSNLARNLTFFLAINLLENLDLTSLSLEFVISLAFKIIIFQWKIFGNFILQQVPPLLLSELI